MQDFSKMWVVTVDKNGRALGDGHWVDIPEPDSYPTDGFAQIESYVIRVVNSQARFTSLIISTPDGQIAVNLFQRGGVPEFGVSVDWRQKPEQERAVRQFFVERSLATFQDYLAGNGGVPDATRCLDYILPADAKFITALIKDIFQNVYGRRKQDALNFTYEERNANAK